MLIPNMPIVSRDGQGSNFRELCSTLYYKGEGSGVSERERKFSPMLCTKWRRGYSLHFTSLHFYSHYIVG